MPGPFLISIANAQSPAESARIAHLSDNVTLFAQIHQDLGALDVAVWSAVNH
jgi:hypothetical protein